MQVFSMGYNDGMYLKYGGKKLEDINKEGLANNFVNYIVLMLIMFVIVLLGGIILMTLLLHVLHLECFHIIF